MIAARASITATALLPSLVPSADSGGSGSRGAGGTNVPLPPPFDPAEQLARMLAGQQGGQPSFMSLMAATIPEDLLVIKVRYHHGMLTNKCSCESPPGLQLVAAVVTMTDSWPASTESRSVLPPLTLQAEVMRVFRNPETFDELLLGFVEADEVSWLASHLPDMPLSARSPVRQQVVQWIVTAFKTQLPRVDPDLVVMAVLLGEASM